MSTASIRSRLPAAALCLAVLLLAATPPAPAQTAWDQQDQADLFGRLAAQGLLRSPASESAERAGRYFRGCRTCREVERRDVPAEPAFLRDAGRDGAAGADLRSSGQENALPALPSSRGAAIAEDGAMRIAPATQSERHVLEL